MTFEETIREIGILPCLSDEYGKENGIEQNPEELRWFSEWLKRWGFRKYLEIGTSGGGLLRFMREYMGYDCYGIDLVPPKHPYDPEKFFVGDCRSPEAHQWAIERGRFDIVFIDASHGYEGVCMDEHLYGPLTGKVLAFHDTLGLRDCPGSKRHWDDIKRLHYGNRREFIDYRAGEKAAGIGVVII